MSAAVTTPWIPPRPTPEILKVDPALLPEYMAWFVNRRAYTRQSDTPNPDNQRYYYYQPKERLTKKRLALDPGTCGNISTASRRSGFMRSTRRRNGQSGWRSTQTTSGRTVTWLR
jgi:hypothetical protein